jgi:hypothetical protein
MKTNGEYGTGASAANDRERDSAKRIGSLASLAHQGSEYSHGSAHTLPELANQGPSDKRSPKIHAPLGELMTQ